MCHCPHTTQGTRTYFAPEMLVKQQRAALEGELAHCIKSQDSAQEPHWEMAWQQEVDGIRGQIAELAAKFENVQNYSDYDGTKVSRAPLAAGQDACSWAGRMQLGRTPFCPATDAECRTQWI